MLSKANGLDERWNQTLKQMLVKYCTKKKKEWDTFLDSSVFAYNTAKQQSTSYTPFELMFGRKAVIPIDLEYEKRSGTEILKEYNETPTEVCAHYMYIRLIEVWMCNWYNPFRKGVTIFPS